MKNARLSQNSNLPSFLKFKLKPMPPTSKNSDTLMNLKMV